MATTKVATSPTMTAVTPRSSDQRGLFPGSRPGRFWTFPGKRILLISRLS